ncbi:MAG TPA: nitroreductase family protein [Candidatus Hydrogenedentes bacterium]|nr:nitroreductase family protein [Candidatus Hydrogenedentota bacterium]
MKELMDIITGRRSVRRYRDEAVGEEALAQLLEAARWAQSWANTQCWEIIVVRDAAVKVALQEAIPEGNPGRRCVESAPVLLAVCGKRRVSGFYQGNALTRFGDWMLFDLGVLTQNIALTAHTLGLGSLVLGLFDHDAARKTLGVPEDFEIVTIMPIGYPAGDVPAPPRREVAQFTHQDRF